MNILDCTIKMRKEAQTNYANLSLAIADKEMKRLFSLLALAEDEHIDKLMEIKTETMTSPTTEYRLTDSVCAYRTKLNPSMKDEEKSIRFFDQLAESAESDTMRKACQAIAEKEREHLRVIENIYSFVEEPRTYLEWGEFSNLRNL